MNQKKITVRRGNPGDLNALVAFNQAMALETENKRLRNDVITSGVSAVLNDPNRGLYFIATLKDAERDRNIKAESIAGALMLTFEWSDWRNGRFWWIQSVYVDPAQRRKGVYTHLHRHVKTLSREDPSCCGIRLYVEEENITAQQTYIHLGMYKTRYHLFEEEYPCDAADESGS